MKKITLLLILCSFQSNYAQNTFPTTGKVGVGTSSPVSNLHVYSTDSPSNVSAGQFQIGGSYNTASDIFLSIGTNKTSEYAFISAGKGGIGNIPLALMATKLDVKGIIKSFEPNGLGSPISSALLINEVGARAGTDNSIYQRLWLYRDNASSSDWLTTRFHDGISVDGTYATPQTDTRTWWERDPLDDIQSWGSAATTYVTINRGKVGIGTENPSVKLDVLGTIKSYETTPLNSSINSYQLINERGGNVGGNSILNRVWFLRDGASNDWQTARVHDGISVDVSFNKPHVDTKTWWERDPLDDIQSWGTAATTYATINKGNVGIGTIVPDEKLTVKGKIHAQEVRVDMTGPLVPDYVFAKDYKLKPLEEVEAYIKQNSHLPEIPSAQEIEKNGLMLAEINMALLKKMEEMTLYMIDMKKENEKMKKDILKLQNQK